MKAVDPEPTEAHPDAVVLQAVPSLQPDAPLTPELPKVAGAGDSAGPDTFGLLNEDGSSKVFHHVRQTGLKGGTWDEHGNYTLSYDTQKALTELWSTPFIAVETHIESSGGAKPEVGVWRMAEQMIEQMEAARTGTIHRDAKGRFLPRAGRLEVTIEIVGEGGAA